MADPEGDCTRALKSAVEAAQRGRMSFMDVQKLLREVWRTTKPTMRINDPVKWVHHAQLARQGDSAYQSVSPCCGSHLLVNRVGLPGAGSLSRLDRCVLCGQRYWYLDDRVNGEDFMEHVSPPNSLVMERR